jgi:hypothetical protein
LATHLLVELPANDLGRLVGMDVFVVQTILGFGAGGVQRRL